jgi:hypothetical protein
VISGQRSAFTAGDACRSSEGAFSVDRRIGKVNKNPIGLEGRAFGKAEIEGATVAAGREPEYGIRLLERRPLRCGAFFAPLLAVALFRSVPLTPVGGFRLVFFKIVAHVVSVICRDGVQQRLMPALDDDERMLLRRSAATVCDAPADPAPFAAVIGGGRTGKRLRPGLRTCREARLKNRWRCALRSHRPTHRVSRGTEEQRCPPAISGVTCRQGFKGMGPEKAEGKWVQAPDLYPFWAFRPCLKHTDVVCSIRQPLCGWQPNIGRIALYWTRVGLVQVGVETAAPRGAEHIARAPARWAATSILSWMADFR